jgi:crotonobetainyl-CoA:carnitine CoA-transferase CaiB-like acyl-CoA transferase
LQAELERRLVEAPTADWLRRLEAAGVPAGPILDLGAVLGGEAEARGSILSLDHPRAGSVRTVGPPWKLDGRPAGPQRPPPLLGEHTAEVLAELAGYDLEPIAKLTD